MAVLAWNEFSPDLDPTTIGSIQDCGGVFPTDKGFRTLPGLAAISSGLPLTCFGAYTAYLLGSSTTVLATVSSLNVVPSGGGAIIPGPTGIPNTGQRWRFSTYGQVLIAVNGSVDYSYTTGGGWALLSGSPPAAALTATTDYAVILVPPDSQTLYSNLSPTASWTPNAATEVYQYTLAQIPGNITAVTKKRAYLAVYRQQALQSASFVGGFIGWDFGNPGTISQTIGVACQEAVINTGDYDYFVGVDFDFWQFDGYNLTRIPNHCKEFFSRDLNQGAAANIAGRYDLARNLIIWHYPSNSTARGQAGNLDSYIGFYMRPQPPRWFFGRLPIELPLSTPAPDPLHTSTTPDSGLVQLDHNLYLYDEQNPFKPVSGVYLTSNDFGDRRHVFQTTRIMPGFSVFPVPSTANPPAKITGLVQMKSGTTPVAAPTQQISDNGWFDYVVTGRLTRFKIELYGTAEITNGEVLMNPTGEV